MNEEAQWKKEEYQQKLIGWIGAILATFFATLLVTSVWSKAARETAGALAIYGSIGGIVFSFILIIISAYLVYGKK